MSQSSRLRSNPGLKLANASGVISERLRRIHPKIPQPCRPYCASVILQSSFKRRFEVSSEKNYSSRCSHTSGFYPCYPGFCYSPKSSDSVWHYFKRDQSRHRLARQETVQRCAECCCSGT